MNCTIFLRFTLMILLSGNVFLAFGAEPADQPTGIKTERNILYVENGHRNQVLDILLPEKPSDKPLPLVVWIHGGAWMGGDQAWVPLTYLVNKGFAVASIQYRFSSDAIWPAQAYDCKAAIRFLRANAAKYNFDPDHFGVGGDSAGGHLAAFVGTSGDVKEMEGDLGNTNVSSRVQAVLDWYGPTDLTLMGQQSIPGSVIQHDAPDSPESKLMGGPIQEKKDLAKTANPITYIDKNDPPFLIMHGDTDHVVPIGQSVILAKALVDAGVEVTMKTIPGADHGGPQFNTPPSQRLIEEFFSQTLKVTANQSVSAAASSADTPKLPFAVPLKWKSSGILINPISDETHNIVSVKDPTIVRYNNKWHIYTTTANTQGHWSIVYLSFADWADAANAKPYYIDSNPNLRGYHCAPQVFYFSPHKKWYLIYQSQHPQYSTTDDISKPETWTKPDNFFEGKPAGAPELWIDYWMICDKTHAYLFFTGDNGRVYRSRTKIEDFPKGMCAPEVVIEGPRNDIFEGSMTYKIKGTDAYLTLVEAMGPARYYRAWISDRLDGKWTPLAGADTWDKPFAGINNVTFQDGVSPWTKDISHGEIIRDGYDETLMIDPKNLQLLYQGRDPSINPRYDQLPYKLGLLKSE